jgi:hypothetical protein
MYRMGWTIFKLTNTSKISAFPDLGAHRSSSRSRCLISKLFIDGIRHRVTPDYAMTGWHNGIRLGGTFEDEAYCVGNPDVPDLWQFTICLYTYNVFISKLGQYCLSKTGASSVSVPGRCSIQQWAVFYNSGLMESVTVC